MIYAEGPLVDETLAIAKTSRPPTVFHPHGLEMFQDQGRLLSNLRSRPMRGVVREHVRLSSRVISQGGKLTAILEGACGADESRIRLLPNALHRDLLAAEARSFSGAPRFLFVGRSEPRKGLGFLLEAMATVPGAALEVVGPHHPSQGAAGGDGVTWHGPIRDRTKLLKVFGRCHFLVLPSLAEGLPTVLLEAMARGLPVIASDVGAVAQLVDPGVNGWMTAPGSSTELGGYMREAAAVSPERYNTMSHSALATIRGGFLEDQVGDALLALLEEVVREDTTSKA